MREPRVAVVIPWLHAVAVEHGSDPLLASLQSVLDQTEPLIEVLVLSDVEASGDEDPMASVRSDDPRIAHEAFPGADRFALLQQGLELARAEAILFLPAGDRLAPTCVSRALGSVASDGGLAAVFCAAESVDGEGMALAVAPEHPSFEDLPSNQDELLAVLVEKNPLPLGGALVRRAIARELGGFAPTFRERADHDLWLRLVAGHRVGLLAERLVRRRWPRIEPSDAALDSAEHARAVSRAFARHGTDPWVRALGGGSRKDRSHQAIARAELARRLVRTKLPPLRPFAHRLLHESRAAGAAPPGDAPFAELLGWLPELARIDGWLEAGAPAACDAEAERLVSPEPRPAPSFPGRLCIAFGVLSPAELADASRLVDGLHDLWAHGFAPLILYAGGLGADHSFKATPNVDIEILRHPGSSEEIQAAFERRGVALLVAEAGHPAIGVASEIGVPFLEPADLAAESGDSADLTARLLRASAPAAFARARAAADEARFARAEATGVQVEARMLASVGGVLARAVSPAPGKRDAASAAETELVESLDEVSRRATALTHLAREADHTAHQTLDKLRLKQRLTSALDAFRGRGSASRNGAARSLDMARAEQFLTKAASAAGPDPALWVVYTTDPYSKTRGQRSTWITRELVRRGHHVVFFYWRWHLEEEIAASPDANVLSVPIDQYFRLERPLMELSGSHLAKRFLIEFPDRFLFEQIDLANAHGFVTIYDCVDDWEEFARAGKAHWYDAGVERHLAAHANLLVATHPELVLRLRGLAGRDAALIPNGVDLDSLLGARGRPEERGAEPVIGYFGHLTEAWFDWELVIETAARHPDWRLEIIGDGAPANLSLPSNLVLIGSVPHEELAARTRAWRVGIVPFRAGRLTRAVDPIKLYEYLALGFPAVLVDMPHFASVPGIFVCRRDAFASCIESALEARLDRSAMERFVGESRWERRVDALLGAISGVVPEHDLLKSI